MTLKHYRFYMDETDLGGFPYQNLHPRDDGLNCFCYAGVLIAEEDIEPIREKYKAFCDKWNITYPLHYRHIRGKRNNFDWVGLTKCDNRRDGEVFVREYHEFMADLPYQVFGAVVNKKRYLSKPDSQNIELITKKSFVSLIDSVASSASRNNKFISFYIERVNREHEKKLNFYLQAYEGNAQNFKDRIVSVYKDDPFAQIADFVAYSVAKASKDIHYRPFQMLVKYNKTRLKKIGYINDDVKYTSKRSHVKFHGYWHRRIKAP